MISKLSFATVALCLVTLLMGCTPPTDTANSFLHNIEGGATPWAYAPEGRNSSQFSFALIGDLHSGEREGVFNVAINQLNLLRPDFILSVGDLIDGGTENLDTLGKQYDFFDQRAARATAPLFHVGGNHDLTNVVMRKFWEERYGRRYYHFIYKDVLFLILDSEDYQEERMHEIYLARAAYIEAADGPNPDLAKDMEYMKMPERRTGEISGEQSEYFEKVIADHPEVRWTMLFMHKPVWQREGENGLSRIETALGSRDYTVINGHLHTYSHTIRNNKDYITLATTSGGQNPDSDMAFDHITVVSFMEKEPIIATLRMDGILDKSARIPGATDDMCFQASKCK
ncbi:MAG: metallophosphoesterase family protein [Cyclobacteriaceae bacterium]